MINVLVFGAGAIGSHIAYCLLKNNCHVDIICRGKHFNAIKKNGMHIKILNNRILLKNEIFNLSKNFRCFKNISNKIIRSKSYDYIFITNKLINNQNSIIKNISKLVKKKTYVLPQCTNLPYWIDETVYKNKNNKNKDFNFILKKYIKKKKLLLCQLGFQVKSLVQEKSK